MIEQEMSGSVNEAAALTTAKHPLALYLPSLLTSMSPEDAHSKVLRLAEMYQIDISSSSSTLCEFHCRRAKWQKHCETHGQYSLPNMPMQALHN